MALTDLNPAGLTADSARLPKRVHDTTPSSPAVALARLAELRQEASQTFKLSQLLDRAPQACLLLMGLGGLILLEASSQGGASLASAFVWSLWILTGIVAMTVVYLRGFARHPAQQSLEAAVAELRKFLLYTGLAWGLGAFLIMPDQPGLGLVLVFAVPPSWGLILILRDEKSALAFSAPVALLTAGAALAGTWPNGVIAAGTVLLAWMAGSFMLHCANRGRSPALR